MIPSKPARLRRLLVRGVRVSALSMASFLAFGFTAQTTTRPDFSQWSAPQGITDTCSHLSGMRLASIDPASRRAIQLAMPRSTEEFKGSRTAALSRVNAEAKSARLAPSRAVARQHISEVDRLAGVPPILADLVSNDSADVLAVAYMPTDAMHKEGSVFQPVLARKRSADRFIPPMSEGDHAWMKTALTPDVFSKAEQGCLATAIYFEARGENPRGQAAVAQVILNRVRNPAYPDTICEVVYQNQDWLNRCQFSFACDGIRDVITDRRAFRSAKDVAMAVTAGKIFLPEVASSTHYNADYVNPSWAQSMQRMTQIGTHIFYRTFGGGWS